MAKRIKWQGKINIECVSAKRDELLQALQEENSLVIDISEMETLDTAGLQLLLSLAKEIKEKGGTLSFDGQVPKDVSRKLVMGGIFTQMVTDGTLLASTLMALV